MAASASLTVVHRRRLRDVYRSAGWPCQDAVEIELLAVGLLVRERGPHGHDTVRVSDAGIALLAQTLQRNRLRRDPHEQLVERVAHEMTRHGRIAWRDLAVRAKVGDAWAMAMPDVFSIRHTTVEAYLHPVVHEIKVSRADLQSDLRSAAKRAAYLQLGSECWYVIRAGIAEPDEIPPECGVLVAHETVLEVARPAPHRAMRLPFDLWMALARATPLPGWRLEDAQGQLGDTDANGMMGAAVVSTPDPDRDPTP
ncbi:MAG: hypothetical protein ABIV63_16650 [Caldimonas sp.]